jgi:hypothetical protein
VQIINWGLLELSSRMWQKHRYYWWLILKGELRYLRCVKMKMMYYYFKCLLCHRSSYFRIHKLTSAHWWITGPVSHQWQRKCIPVAMVSWDFFLNEGKNIYPQVSQTNWI